jgi:hypothetical protein
MQSSSKNTLYSSSQDGPLMPSSQVQTQLYELELMGYYDEEDEEEKVPTPKIEQTTIKEKLNEKPTETIKEKQKENILEKPLEKIKEKPHEKTHEESKARIKKPRGRRIRIKKNNNEEKKNLRAMINEEKMDAPRKKTDMTLTYENFCSSSR